MFSVRLGGGNAFAWRILHNISYYCTNIVQKAIKKLVRPEECLYSVLRSVRMRVQIKKPQLRECGRGFG